MRVTVVGAGSWVTAVATIVGGNHDVLLWARRREVAEAINSTRENPDYLQGYPVSAGVTAVTDLEAAVATADVVVMGVPSHGYRDVLEQVSGAIGSQTPIVSLSKGIEQQTLMRMTEVTADVLPGHDPARIGVLSGPNLAREVAAGQPAATVVAFTDERVAAEMQAVFKGPTFRVYTNTDVIGVEAAGALKNVMAIGAGIAQGMGFGMNTLATLVTRSLFELTRLGSAFGGRPLTFAGLAGMGDLVATCMSSQSRNHQVGFGLGQGKALADIVAEMNMVAEGVKSTRGILALAEREGVEMAIAEQVGRVLYEGATAAEILKNLMGREAGSETDGLTETGLS